MHLLQLLLALVVRASNLALALCLSVLGIQRLLLGVCMWRQGDKRLNRARTLLSTPRVSPQLFPSYA